MKLFAAYLRDQKKALLAFFLFAAVFAGSFCLYHLPLEAVLYPAALCVLLGLAMLAADFFRMRKRHQALSRLHTLPADLIGALPDCGSITDRDYHAMINRLCGEMKSSGEAAACQYRDMVDYYTVWAHQIKTPIAAMRLQLQSEDTPQSRRLLQELKRIERYVGMVLTFLRLGAESTDYVIRSCDLDGIVRPAVKQFAGEFIGKKLTLHYEPLEASVVTDQKWLSFVIEQVLSNAVKYTPAGGAVSLYLEAPQTLCIADTGIGIAPEDLPRIFENGYTGFNGRTDQRASGIGLYLCRQICDRLGHGLSASSEVGKGTVIRIDLHRRPITME